MKNIVILISGGGSNMAAIVRAALRDDWQRLYGASVAAVVSNRPDAGGLAIATAVVDHKAFPSREAFDAALAQAIDAHAPALVVLAGFMRILTPGFVARYQGRLLNIHPSLLPAFPGLHTHQRALDEGGRSGLEEERRLAYVGITRAKKRLHIWFVSNRRIHGLWQSTIPSRFLDELPEAHVEVAETEQNYGGYGRNNPYGQSRFDRQEPFQSSYNSPGWQRAQANKTDATRNNWGNRSGYQVERIGYGEAGPQGKVIAGELVAKSKIDTPSAFSVGDRVFHIKFGNGNVAAIEGNKLTIDFDRAGQKRVLDGFVERV